MFSPWAALRNARHALPERIGRRFRGPGAAAAARTCRRLDRRRFAATVGYFDAGNAPPEDIVAAYLSACKLLSHRQCDVYISIKAPPLHFDYAHVRTVAEAAAADGLKLMFDAHSPDDADRTLDLLDRLLADFPATGFVLPARWRRSSADAARFRDTSARIRVVKGEWPDPERCIDDIEASYLRLVSNLSGRSAPIAVATHDPRLAERALTTLLAAGTPCELEQLRGLPRRRTVAVAKQLGAPVRIYVPFGPGWWPYAIDKALARPYLLSWMIEDLLGSRESPARDAFKARPTAAQ